MKDKEREANSLWTVDRSDLKLNDPPTVLGHGSFGFVLQGEYRGSKVAVKRVLLASGKTGGLDSSIFGPPLKLDDSLGSSNLVGEEAEPGSTGRSTDYSVDLEVGESGAFGSSNRSRSSSRGQARLSQSMHTMSTLMMTKRNTSGQSMKQAFIDEMRVLSKLRHPNITTLMGKNGCYSFFGAISKRVLCLHIPFSGCRRCHQWLRTNADHGIHGARFTP